MRNKGFSYKPFSRCGLDGVLRLFIATAIGISAFSAAGGAYAETTGGSVYSQAPGALYFLKLSLVLVFVLGIFLLFAKILRQVNGVSHNTQGPMKVIAGLSLSSRERLVIVKAGNTQMLLGISNAGMAKLHQFDEDIEMQINADNQSPGSFKGRFEQVLSGMQK